MWSLKGATSQTNVQYQPTLYPFVVERKERILDAKVPKEIN